MKSTAQIDVLTFDKKGDVFTVTYWDESIEDSEIIIVEINEDLLIEYIIENELNVVGFINYDMRNLECDGMDERSVDPYNYLSDNALTVIKSYIEDNL